MELCSGADGLPPRDACLHLLLLLLVQVEVTEGAGAMSSRQSLTLAACPKLAQMRVAPCCRLTRAAFFD
eukprot:scaffold2091_cov122-Isochrysis_galbana.AAC.3